MDVVGEKIVDVGTIKVVAATKNIKTPDWNPLGRENAFGLS